MCSVAVTRLTPNSVPISDCVSHASPSTTSTPGSDTLRKVLDADEKGEQSLPTPGGNQRLLVVTEPGLYKLMARRLNSRV